MANQFFLRFEGVSVAEAERLAAELDEWLAERLPETEVHREPSAPNTQNLGDIVVLLAGTPAAALIARGIMLWLQKRNSAEITIVTKNNKIVAKNVTAGTAVELLEEALKDEKAS